MQIVLNKLGKYVIWRNEAGWRFGCWHNNIQSGHWKRHLCSVVGWKTIKSSNGFILEPWNIFKEPRIYFYVLSCSVKKIPVRLVFQWIRNFVLRLLFWSNCKNFDKYLSDLCHCRGFLIKNILSINKFYSIQSKNWAEFKKVADR